MTTIVRCNCGAEYKRTEAKFLVPHTGHASCKGTAKEGSRSSNARLLDDSETTAGAFWLDPEALKTNPRFSNPRFSNGH